MGQKNKERKVISSLWGLWIWVGRGWEKLVTGKQSNNLISHKSLYLGHPWNPEGLCSIIPVVQWHNAGKEFSTFWVTRLLPILCPSDVRKSMRFKMNIYYLVLKWRNDLWIQYLLFLSPLGSIRYPCPVSYLREKALWCFVMKFFMIYENIVINYDVAVGFYRYRLSEWGSSLIFLVFSEFLLWMDVEFSQMFFLHQLR